MYLSSKTSLFLYRKNLSSYLGMARVMIAEDSEAVRLVLKDSLKVGHHEIVAEAVNGIEAIKKFNETNPDVLLLDVAMPQKDGISALKEIMSYNPDAKIIMIT